MATTLGKAAKLSFALVFAGSLLTRCVADDITTLDGHKYENVRDVMLKPKGLFFVIGTGDAMRGEMVAYTNLPDELQDKYHYDPFEPALAYAHQDPIIVLNTNMAYSLATLDAAKARARAEHKLLGFIMVWDEMFDIPSHPMGRGSNDQLAHFYLAFHNNLVLVFVHHETELNNVPGAVRNGFFGPDEGGWAPNMAVVSADCSQYVCEIPLGGGKETTGTARELVFRQKIQVIKQFLRAQARQ